jgi:hypothetical protein
MSTHPSGMGVRHVGPVQPQGHAQVSGATQVPPFWQMLVHKGVPHVNPPQPDAQVQKLGAVQVPPFWQVC